MVHCQPSGLVVEGQPVVTSGHPWFSAGIPGIYVVLLCDVLHSLGDNPGAFLKRQGLSREQLLDPECRLPLDQAQAAAERALALAGERGLGFRYARVMRITLHGPVGLLALSSATLDDGLEAARRYLGLRAPFLDIERVGEADNVALHLRADVALGPIEVFVQEALLIGFVYMLEQLLEGAPKGAVIHFRGVPPAYAATLIQAVPVPVLYGQADNALVLSRALLAARPRLADPQAAALAREQCELEFRRWRSQREGPLPERIRVALRDQPAPLPDLPAMAQRLAVSSRTLKRHLQQAGLSYRQLQDEARYRQACKLLADRRRRVSDVAFELGYNDAANFSRAFKRWSGQTPKAYRA